MIASSTSTFYAKHVPVRFLPAVPIGSLAISDLNPRVHRDEQHLKDLVQSMDRFGFDPTYPLKTYQDKENGIYLVFAGGNRLLAAKQVGLATLPVYIYENLSRSELWQLAHHDNEVAGQHCPINPVDVWCDYARRVQEDGWSQSELAQWLGISPALVSLRVRLSEVASAKAAVLAGLLDESHCHEILAVLQPAKELAPWLTTDQARQELINEVTKNATNSAKPSRGAVRNAVKRWKKLVQAVISAYQSLTSGREEFVRLLGQSRVRTEAEVNQVLNQVLTIRRQEEREAALRLKAEADRRTREEQQLEQQQRQTEFITQKTRKLGHGDARNAIKDAPDQFRLLLTDPPYGMKYQSQRRVATPRKPELANDTPEAAFQLLRDVLSAAYPKMAENATCLIFTGWRFEPEFRQIITEAGFEIKGSLIWVKNNHGTGDLEGSFAPKHERILHAVKGKPKLLRRLPDVLYGKATPQTEHPTEKPPDLLAQLIEAVTEPGQIIVDPFFGSGNVLTEAYRLGRDFFGCELDEQWYRVGVDRIHQLAQEEFARELGTQQSLVGSVSPGDQTHPGRTADP